MALKLVTGPTSEPVTDAEALAHCRIDHHDDDLLVRRLITAARRRVETTLRRSLLATTWRLSLGEFPCDAIVLPRPPAQSVSSIAYIDSAGASQTLASYQLDSDSEPAGIHPAYGEVWPSTRCQPNAVQVTFVAGYASAAAVPQTIKLAILMLVGHWYEHRESVTDESKLSETPQSVEFLLAGERVFRFV